MIIPPVTITSEGWELSQRKLDRMATILGDPLTSYLVEAVQEAINIMKFLLNVSYPPASVAGEAPHRRTGDLQDSIDIDKILTHEVIFGMNAYGVWLNYGTATILPRPFIEPALLQLKDNFPDIIFSQIRTEFERNG